MAVVRPRCPPFHSDWIHWAMYSKWWDLVVVVRLWSGCGTVEGSLLLCVVKQNKEEEGVKMWFYIMRLVNSSKFSPEFWPSGFHCLRFTGSQEHRGPRIWWSSRHAHINERPAPRLAPLQQELILSLGENTRIAHWGLIFSSLDTLCPHIRSCTVCFTRTDKYKTNLVCSLAPSPACLWTVSVNAERSPKCFEGHNQHGVVINTRLLHHKKAG